VTVEVIQVSSDCPSSSYTSGEDDEESETDEEDDISELERFTAFARSQEQTLDDVVPEQNQNIYIAGNVAFFNGIAQDLTEYELSELRRQLNSTSHSSGTHLSENLETVKYDIDSYCLCSYKEQIDLLTTLDEFAKYCQSAFIHPLRP
jgi:hypothetical protein